MEEILRQRRQPAGEPGPSCADAELLSAYVEGGLGGEARTRFESHLASCAHCQAAVVRLVRLAPADSAARPAAEPARTAAPASGFRWRWAIHALAGLVLVGSFAYYERSRLSEIAQDARTAQYPASLPARDEAAPAETDRAAQPEPAKEAPQPATPAAAKPAPPAGSREALEEKGAATGAKLEQQAPAEKQKKSEAAALADKTLAPSSPAPARVAAEPPEGTLRKDSRGGLVGGVSGGMAPSPPAAPVAPPAKAEAAANAPFRADAATVNRQATQSALPAFPSQQARPGGPRAQQMNQANLAQNQANAAPAQANAAPAQANAAPAPAGQAMEQRQPPAADNEVPLARRERELQALHAQDATKRGAAVAGGAGGPVKATAEMAFAPNLAPRGKVLEVGNRAFGISQGQLVMRPSGAAWEIAELPARGAVLDFAVSGRNVWVLLSGGRLLNSPNLGTTWRPVVSTGLADATTVSFSSESSGEVRNSSGQRRVTTDAGRTWTAPEN